ncbi:hypothetical protein C0J52_01703 [Blattella germanica]|nr:hypothetical protein C0J52_01703 [Blattella germanica]
MNEEERNAAYFQQDSAIAHTARASMREITSVFGNHVIRRVCGLCAPLVYKTTPHSLQEFQVAIERENRCMILEELQRVF